MSTSMKIVEVDNTSTLYERIEASNLFDEIDALMREGNRKAEVVDEKD